MVVLGSSAPDADDALWRETCECNHASRCKCLGQIETQEEVHGTIGARGSKRAA
jgi:hypothetical protein